MDFGVVRELAELSHYTERYMAGEFKLNDFIIHPCGWRTITRFST